MHSFQNFAQFYTSCRFCIFLQILQFFAGFALLCTFCKTLHMLHNFVHFAYSPTLSTPLSIFHNLYATFEHFSITFTQCSQFCTFYTFAQVSIRSISASSSFWNLLSLMCISVQNRYNFSMFYMTQRIMDYRKIWHQDSLALDNLTPDNLVPGQFGTVLIKGQFCTRKSHQK